MTYVHGKPATLTKANLEYLAHHIFLPTKLPGGDDSSAKNEILMVNFVLDTLVRFMGECTSEDETAIEACVAMIKGLKISKSAQGSLSANDAQEVLRHLSPQAPVALLHVAAQNGGVLVRKTITSAIFETFELSPANKAVMTTQGRLVRQFPANATEIPSLDFEDETFLSVFTKTLEKMSYQTVQETVHKARKAEQEHDEDRETVEPRIVTDLLPSMLRGVGKQVTVPGICKNTREEVMWSNSKLPWRRSPVWLLIRVGLQLTMTRLARKDKDPYKEFMVFLMAQVLDVAVKQGAKSDILHTMSTKLSRRLCKLKYRSNGRWLQSIQQIVSEASKCLARRWDRIRKQEEKLLKLNDLQKPEMEDSLHFTLLKMEEFLTSIPERGKHIEFPNFIPISHVRPLDGNNLPTYRAGDETYLPFRLAMIESWVAASLDTWLKSHIEEENLCGDLKRLAQSYHSEASRWYFSRPEGASRMLLTIGELWVAADKAAIHALPMLRCYEHEVPIEVWQTLLLASMADMERLHSLEAYLLNRHRVARSMKRPSIFRSYGHQYSFPVQYFSGSVEHQQLKAEIEERALAQRQAKIEELRRLKKEYETLMQRFNDAKCDEYPQEEYGITVWRHSYACVRHGYLSKANNLQIQVHEWPLPKNTLGAQATVFELAVPPIFSEWRDITLYLINDVLLSQPSGVHHPNPSYSLRAYQPLDKFFRTRRDYRIHLVSEAKPNVVTHRRDKPIQYCTDSDVCVNNGLRYQYYDGNQDCFLGELLPTEGLSNICTFDLPKRAQALKRFLVRTWLKPEGETPNEVIASQSDCPEYLSLSEYKVLAELPYGYNIQWMSILTQLAMPKIDFNKTETAIFLLQTNLQAGPRSSTSTRCTHLRLKDREFGHQMLEHLTKSVSHIQENWESYTALFSYTLLASRLLSQVPSELSHAFLGLLEKCRRISYRWWMTILGRVQETTNEIRRSGFLKTALTIALICGDSFNVYDGFLPVILADAKQASMLVECSIIIYNNASLKSEAEATLRGILFDRWNYTMHRVCAIFVEQNHLVSPCLDLAIKRHWSAFQPTASWTLAAETSYWFETTSHGHLQVHYNILTGELLVNGLPLTRLPEQYERHDDYERLFRSLILNVMPSNLPGMRFCTTQQFQGHIVHFGMQDQDLLVRLEVNESYLDLIPSRTLRDMLPHCFVNDYAHWYHNKAGIIQLRSLKDPWTSNPDDWCFVRQDGGWKLCQGGRTFLFAPSSSMARHIAGILSPLEAPLGLHMLYDARKSALEVRVPSLRLDFLLTAGESIFRSRQFRGMYIDSDQSVGTLVGFKSKLVLRNDQDPSTRIVLISEGDIHFRRLSGHVTVNAAYGTADRVQAYRIDDLLGRLIADTKLESKLYLAYIHSLTSFCLPDPFLGRTGTEEALRILGSASVRAPCPLSWTAHDRLNLISALAPRRAFYPTYEKVMQKVDWSSNLGFLAQDDRLYAATKEILGRCSKIGFLYPHHNIEQSEIIHNTVGLVERAILRNSRQCVSGFGAEDFTVRHDAAYQSRERDDSGRAERATEMAFRAYNKLPTFSKSLFADFAQHLYALLSSESTISDRAIPPREDMLYDSNWLKNPTNFLSSYWCRLHYAFQHNHIWLNKFELMVWIATVAYSAESDNQVTQTLLLLALSTSVSTIPLPPDGQYDLSLGYNMKATELESIARIAAFRYEQTPAARLEPRLGESWQQTWNRRHREYQSETNKAAELFREELARQWPCRRPRASSDGRVTAYINVSKAMASVVKEWTKWYSNRQFAAYLTKLAKGLGEVPVDGIITDLPSAFPDFQPTSRPPGFLSIDDLFHGVPPSPTLVPDSLLEGLHQATWTNPGATARLPAVLDFLDREAKLDYEHHYLRELRQSLASLKGHAGHELNMDRVPLCADLFQKHLKRCKGRVKSIYGSLLDAVNQDLEDLPEAIQHIVKDTGFRPRTSPIFFLQQLRSSRWSQLPSTWQDAIIEYGQVITALQQAKRLIRFQNDPVDLLRELESSGHRNWNPREHPEWLLLECESEILIRDVQQQIAQKMIQPPDNKNSVMQLNMGEGKSSVIVPSVAAALGDGSKLIRVIVAKPQAKQLHQMLTSKLSGLLDRPVYQLPFSRDIRMNESRAEAIHQLISECMQEGGVLLVQPEHLLSFQLMELECQLDNKSSVAEKMMEVRKFFDTSSRDVVDESDENFSVKFELIYTVGQQRPIDHSPDRWRVIQEILGLVARFSAEVKQDLPQSLDYDDRRDGRVPKVRILRPDAEKAIFDRVTTFICETGMDGFPIAHQHPTVRNAVRRYITKWDMSGKEIEAVEKSAFWHESTINHILLLRGLFASGILSFVFAQKRWRVSYGLDPNREKTTKLAVPFRAKDNPTPRSEFSHPDVVIVLTCLTYYYGGLDNEALFTAFDLLIRSDNADLEYQEWVKASPTIPDAFKHIQGVNLKDHVQCVSEVFPCIKYSKAAIDYYLCRMVFAKESREFPHKLSASGWDLGKQKQNPTTGFSGTNDSRYVLPLDMKQLDIPEQKHTNALVLEYLLQPENAIALAGPEVKGAALDSRSLLDMVINMGPNTRVILDVGAQVIEFTNLEFSKEWLKCYKDEEHIQAVIFFNDSDEIMVLDRSGKVEELQTSPFADQLDQCLIFLDEAHTRGTDLRLPANYRAAVTLGANLTKDRLVQACMRMRKLGKGQTVIFCIPREIEQKILQLLGQESSGSYNITVADVLCWAINETCQNMRRELPLWFTQGIRFCQQRNLWDEIEACSDCKSRSECAGQFKEDEAQSLGQRYHPQQAHPNIYSFLDRIEPCTAAEFRKRCQEFGLTELRTSSLQGEQERELSPETEHERQVERPLPAEPEIHHLHEDVRSFVLNGVFSQSSSAFKPAFMALEHTSAAKNFDVSEFRNHVWATQDFARTVKGSFGSNNYADSFQRSVQWVLTNEREIANNRLLVISPYEAQYLLPDIETSRHVTLRLYSSRVNLGFESLDHLNLFTIPQKDHDNIPRRLITQLNVFAGQLYLSSYSDYVQVCDSLGLAWKAPDESIALGPDGFLPPNSTGSSFSNKSGLSRSPVGFLKVLMSIIRQECELIGRTHMGRILEGVRLHEEEWIETQN
ncbi:hypothetical protein Forpe1208_v012432 [Fusarium oxysporum f. sp. rapae]|nr:hypothetical protein Forpe1208_v012432 [Fusarium oxysporum f. sp. rapae]